MKKKNQYSYSNPTVADVTFEEEEKEKEGIEKEYAEKSQKGKTKKHKYNLFIYILSLLIAIVLWFFVMSVESPTSQSAFSGIDVMLDHASELQSESGLSVVSGSGHTIEITLRGKKSTLNKLKSSDIRAYVDLAQLSEAGTRELNIEYELPSGTEFVSSSLSAISVYVDTTTTKTVPVKVKLKDYILEEGYELGNPAASIDSIVISGSRSELDKVKEARAVLSNLGKLTNSLDLSTSLILCDENGVEIESRYININAANDTVHVTVPVYQRKDVPLTVSYKYGLFNEENVNVTIEPAFITIKGESASVSAVNSIEIGVLDEKSISKDASFTYPISLPDNVTSLYSADSANVTVHHVGTLTKDIVVSKIKVNNPNSEISYILNDTSIKVTARCNSDRSSQITMDNVIAELDLSSIGTQRGMMELPVTINFIGEAYGAAYEIGDYTVSVGIWNSDSHEGDNNSGDIISSPNSRPIIR